MKIILRMCVFIIAILQVSFGSELATRSLGGEYTCTYKETPEIMITKDKGGFGYVIMHPNKVEIVTIHGIVETNHPLIRELINSQPFQRLKKINQYGVCEFIKKPLCVKYPSIGYTRYEHSLGTLVIIIRYSDQEGLKLLKRVICGLLHDMSHTPFSHSLDILLRGGFLVDSYQDLTLISFIKRHGIVNILTHLTQQVLGLFDSLCRICNFHL